MKFIATTLYAFLAASANAAVLRGNGDNISTQTRHLLQDGMECVPYLRHVSYADKSDEYDWSCEFSAEDAAKIGGRRIIDLGGVTTEEVNAMGTISGGSILRLGSSSFLSSQGPMAESGSGGPVLLNLSGDFEIVKMDEGDVRHYRNRRARRERRNRNLAESAGTLRTLVVRVKDVGGAAQSLSVPQIYKDVYDDKVCLKSQMNKCSHGAVTIEPSPEGSTKVGKNTYNGIVEIDVGIEAAGANYMDLQSEAINAVWAEFGNFDDFDLIMFAQAPGSVNYSGSTGWLAYAFVNGWLSVYNEGWMGPVSAQMHEVGHNIGLQHSGRRGVGEYADISDFMGYAWSEDDTNMCYNAAKNYQLNWFPEQMDSVNPLELPDGEQTFKLNGVPDYDPTGKNGNGLVTLRLEHEGEQAGGSDYYIGYNRATGITADVKADANMVQLHEKVSDNENDIFGPGQSYRIAALGEGDSYTWNIGETEMVLEVTEIDGKDAYIRLTASGGTGEPEEKCPKGDQKTYTLLKNNKTLKCKKLKKMSSKKAKKQCKLDVNRGTPGLRKVFHECPVTCGKLGQGQCAFLKDQK